jgi:hypothetical protein
LQQIKNKISALIQAPVENEASNSPLGAGGVVGGVTGVLYGEVIIPLALPQNYTWSIPPEFQFAAKPGCSRGSSAKE